jgi:uncharacterized membrane protein YidH (DUF202 family)
VTEYDADSRDPGLAAERTDLAWNRSGLSLIACGAAVVRGLAGAGGPHGNLVVGASILALGVITWALGSWHLAQARARRERRTTLTDLLPISAGVAGVGLAAFVLCLVWPA